MNSTKKWENILEFLAIVLGIWLLGIYANTWTYRIDLTENKQFTLSKATKRLLKKLDETVYIEIYLDGDLNADFKRLQKNIKYKLESFKRVANRNIDYQFINPDKSPTKKGRQRFYQEIIQRGIQPTNLYDNQNGKKIQKIIFPGAIINYAGQETSVLFLKGNQKSSAKERINQSIEGIEYELAQGIYKLSGIQKKKLGFTIGHNELTKRDLEDLFSHLKDLYTLNFTPIDSTIFQYDALVIAQPKAAFNQIDKFWIDQYLMDNGKVLFFIDNIHVNIDSIAESGVLGLPYNLELGDMFFKYGLKVNTNLLQDQQAGFIEVVTGNFGDRTNIQRVPWPYYIYLNKFSKHFITKNLNIVYSKFVGSIDTVPSPKLIKTPLVFSSEYTRIKAMPNVISLEELKEDLKPELYKHKHVPVAYLVEGQFESIFSNYFFPPQGVERKIRKKGGKDSKLLVFSDGDIIKNDFNKKTGELIPIDLDPAQRQNISNKTFMTNLLSYLTDEKGIIIARKNEIALRPLDKFKINANRTWLQIINIGIPILWVIFLGLLRFYWRKHKYSQ